MQDFTQWEQVLTEQVLTENALKNVAASLKAMKTKVTQKGMMKFMKATKNMANKSKGKEGMITKKMLITISKGTGTPLPKLESVLTQFTRSLTNASYTLMTFHPIMIILLVVAYSKYSRRAKVRDGHSDMTFGQFFKAFVLKSSLYKAARQGSLSHKVGTNTNKTYLASIATYAFVVVGLVGFASGSFIVGGAAIGAAYAVSLYTIIPVILAVRGAFQAAIAQALGYDPSVLSAEQYEIIKNKLDMGQLPTKKDIGEEEEDEEDEDEDDGNSPESRRRQKQVLQDLMDDEYGDV
jgi:hypothetical protein